MKNYVYIGNIPDKTIYYVKKESSFYGVSEITGKPALGRLLINRFCLFLGVFFGLAGFSVLKNLGNYFENSSIGFIAVIISAIAGSVISLSLSGHSRLVTDLNAEITDTAHWKKRSQISDLASDLRRSILIFSSVSIILVILLLSEPFVLAKWLNQILFWVYTVLWAAEWYILTFFSTPARQDALSRLNNIPTRRRQ